MNPQTPRRLLVLLLTFGGSFSLNLEAQVQIIGQIPPPHGFHRVSVEPGSFGQWLRDLPLKPPGTPVKLFDRRLKARQDVHYRVLDLELENRDLQQCADAVMRLRSEYLFQRGQGDRISFTLATGEAFPFQAWAQGKRLRVAGQKQVWIDGGAQGATPANLKTYLRYLYAYAGTLSLVKDLVPAKTIRPGDVVIQGGSPGHAVILVDLCQDPRTGAFWALLAQSYMPAQDIHILKNPSAPQSPWYEIKLQGPLSTPEWDFRQEDRKTWP